MAKPDPKAPVVVVFRAERSPGGVVYDLLVNGRVREYDVEQHEFAAALRRARVKPTDAYVEDLTGYRTPLRR